MEGAPSRRAFLFCDNAHLRADDAKNADSSATRGWGRNPNDGAVAGIHYAMGFVAGLATGASLVGRNDEQKNVVKGVKGSNRRK